MTAPPDEEDWTDLPLFAPEGAKIPCETSADDTPAVSALSHLIYDEDTPEEKSELLREQGNRSFKLGKRGYKRAIDLYTSAIDAAHGGIVALPAYLNRANAHARLGNHGYALADAKEALLIDEKNVKALYRCATSAKVLRRYAECVKFCDIAINEGGDAFFEELRRGAVEQVEKARRLNDGKEDENVRVERMLEERGIRIGAPLFGMQTRYAQTMPRWDEGWLWPVMIVYVGDVVERSDYLPAVEEHVTMEDILYTVLIGELDWDKNGFYEDIMSVEMRFRKDWTVMNDSGEGESVVGSEVCQPGEWVTVGRDVPLVEVLMMEDYVTPLFPVLYAVPIGWKG